jgi:acetate kinase
VHILVVNGGSSSIKFSVYDAAPETPRIYLEGEITGIGSQSLHFVLHVSSGQNQEEDADGGADPVALLEKAVQRPGMPKIDAVGYRVVHPGPRVSRHCPVTPELLQDLEAAIAFAPLHDPQAITLIRDMMQRFAEARHYACFDTVFHQTMPPEASTYAIPVSYRERGVRRYGFHGLSCEGVVADLRALAREKQTQFPGKMCIAHLGSGCSVTALVDGRSVENTMGLTPTGGVVMGTRPGDLDPGLVLYLLREQKGDVKEAESAVEHMLNNQAGMVALSDLPNDMRATRQAASKGNAEAQLAIAIFTRAIRKAIGAFAWLLGGLDAIVFTGGIGEHDAASRADILSGVERQGVILDTDANQATGDHLRKLSAANSKTEVWVVKAQEDRTIALHVRQMHQNKEK